MHQYLFHIGDFPIRAYGVVITIAFLIGLGVTAYLMKVEGKKSYITVMFDMAPWLLIGAVVGARFWQVFFFEWDFYKANPGEILAVWHGGLSIQGGIIGGLIVAVFYLRYRKVNFWEFADFSAPGIILAQGIGRSANLLNGDAFGDPTGGDFGILYPEGTLAREVFGDQPLWPAEIWEGQIDVLIFAILIILRLKKYPSGFHFLLYAMLYNTARIFLEMLRGDSSHLALNFTAAQWTSVIVILVCAVLMIWRFKKESPPKTIDND